MLLTIQQKFYLDTVRKLRCLRFTQLHTLLQRQFYTSGESMVSENHMAAMFRQLCYCNYDIHAEGGYIYIANAAPDSRLLEAVDIMLELSQQSLSDFKVTQASPIVLRFSLGGEKLRLFSVASLSLAENVNTLNRQKMEQIIWIADNGVLPEGLILPPKHFFAARQEDGTHRFYGSTES